MRLFVAIELTAAMRDAAERIVVELRARASRLAPAARVTWLTAERMHLTLAFIGETAEARVPAIVEALTASVRDVPAFELRLGGLGTFAPRGRPRVLWVGVTDGREPLVELGSQVTAALAALGIPLEDRPLHPHLTLGRVREATGLRPATLYAGFDGTVPGATRVGAITLFQSRLSPAGPEYTVVARCPLAGGAAEPPS